MLSIKNLHASVEDKEILKGINLEIKEGEVHAIMGPNGAGKSTLSSIIAGNENYEVSEGEIILDGEDLSELAPEERAHKGVFLSFQYPVEIPGVSVTNFIKTAINEKRKANGQDEMPANEMLKLIREKFYSEICEQANLTKIISENPIELAYCLALINCKNRYSITPPWVLKTYPEVERIMNELRNKPCLNGCKYCNQALDIYKGLKTKK